MQVGETRPCPPDLLEAIKRLVHFHPNPLVDRNELAVIALNEYPNDLDCTAQWEIDLRAGEITRQKA